jgi:hypothetical protein
MVQLFSKAAPFQKLLLELPQLLIRQVIGLVY